MYFGIFRSAAFAYSQVNIFSNQKNALKIHKNSTLFQKILNLSSVPYSKRIGFVKKKTKQAVSIIRFDFYSNQFFNAFFMF